MNNNKVFVMEFQDCTFLKIWLLCYTNNMNILLVGINASYMHTNLAIRSIYNYIINQRDYDSKKTQINFIEFTINQPIMQIMRQIASYNADVVLFSSYIWNAMLLESLIIDLKKVNQNCLIGAGGPEFSYAPEKYLKKILTLDFIIFGEGEEITWELVKSLENNTMYPKGVYFLQNAELIFTQNHQLIQNLDDIPFSYPELQTNNFDADNKIYYYESSRGCPYSCSYCLSSVDKTVRFKTLEKVFLELQIFLDANVKLVKFVDRTFNLKPERYIKIWEYIVEHHNGKTMFHFEIEAEYLSKEALNFLQTVPSGIMQFEIGFQSANQKTLKIISRSDNIEKLCTNILALPKTIHKHLDLIAGLPYEDLQSFGKSFDFVMSLKPDALQLGFLKILNGTNMQTYANQNDWKWQENPMYEVFSTPYLSFSDISYLKDIEVLVDEYWNKGLFNKTFDYIFRTMSLWSFFTQLCDYARDNNAFESQRKDLYWFSLLNDFICTFNQSSLLKNLLKYDFVKSGKKGNFPQWYNHIYDKEKHRALLEEAGLLHSTRLAYSITEYEVFDYNVQSNEPEKFPQRTELLIRYDAE